MEQFQMIHNLGGPENEIPTVELATFQAALKTGER